MADPVDTALTTRRTLMQVYVDAITTALYQNDAQLALEAHLAAYKSYLNVNQGGSSSYSSPIGDSHTKRDIQDVLNQVDATWSRFVSVCAIGGVTVDGATYSDIGQWSLQ